MRNQLRKTSRWSVLLLVALLATPACGDDAQPEPKLNVDVIGWGPGQDGTLGFQSGLPSFQGAELVKVRLTQPGLGRVLSEETYNAGNSGATLPSLDFGRGLRLEFEALDGDFAPVAMGATPEFDYTPDQSRQTYRIQVDRVNEFAPVGSEVNSQGQRELTQSRMDYRGDSSADWLGRIGHVTVPFAGGNKVLTVGGADVSVVTEPGAMPQLRAVHDDLMEFDPVTGYFTDLAVNEATGAPLPNKADRLLQGRAYHTVTPIGDDKFLVVGGLAPNEPSPRTLPSIELIDLNASPGTRVQQLADGAGTTATLNQARAYHTATYRPADNTVVVAGGIGRDGEALDSVEFINLDSGSVNSEMATMAAARAEHEAVLMGDGETVWLLGGRDDSQALASTEIVERSGDIGQAFAESAMNTPRFAFSAFRISPNQGRLLMVVGGYTSLDGDVTDRFEFSSLGRGEFLNNSSWRLDQGRGNLSAVELPTTNDIVVLGGRDAQQNRVGEAEILDFGALADANPYVAKPTQSTSYNQRSAFTANLLNNGKIVLVGGIGRFDGRTTTLDSAEFFTPLDATVPQPSAD